MCFLSKRRVADYDKEKTKYGKASGRNGFEKKPASEKADDGVTADEIEAYETIDGE